MQLEQPLDLVKLSLDSNVSVKLKGGRHVTGKLHGFDAHLNLVLGGAVETKEGETATRSFPMLFIRGDSVILVSPSA